MIEGEEMKAKSQAFIEWDDRFKLGIQLIDRQHERLVFLTNNLHLACLHSTQTANHYFVDTIHQLVDYVNFHFTTEEKLMRLLEFEGYSIHKKGHESFIKEVLIQTEKFSQASHLVPNRFVHFLKDWILGHIAVCDKAMADFVLDSKYHKKLEQLTHKSA